jgi:hypothetical protein
MGIEHPDPLPGRVGREALLDHRCDNQVSETDGGGACT